MISRDIGIEGIIRAHRDDEDEGMKDRRDKNKR
jgi:hypothetical protein